MFSGALNLFTPAVASLYAALLSVLVLLRFMAPGSRKRLAADTLMAFVAAIGLALCGLLLHSGMRSRSTPLLVLSGGSNLLLLMASVNAAGVLVFDLCLPALRIRGSALMRDLILASGYLMAAFAVLSASGVNVNSLIATSAVFTAIVAFSLQDTLGNIMGGMMLNFENIFEPGDLIRLYSGEEGQVRHIRWRQTTIETNAGDTIVIPNSSLMKGVVTVIGRRHGRPHQSRRGIEFYLSYDYAPSGVAAAVEKLFEADMPPNVARDPKPQCVVLNLDESRVTYGVRYWLTNVFAATTTDSAVRTRIYYALAREGIKMSVSASAVVVMQNDQELAERTKALEKQRRAAALRGVEIFAALTDAEIETLVERLKSAPFARGEVLTHQGAKANWLYIIVSGEAQVVLKSADGAAEQGVARLGPGSFMGEMGLLTGEPRSATVRALSEMMCYRLDSEGFTDIISRRPQIAESIAKTLASRRAELDAARTGLDENTRRQSVSRAQVDILSRIQNFFTLR